MRDININSVHPPPPSPQPSHLHLQVLVISVLIFMVLLKVACSCYKFHRAILDDTIDEQYVDMESGPEIEQSWRESLLKEIPVYNYACDCSEEVSVGESCSICLEVFEREEEVRVLPRCGHLYHRICIDKWLVKRSVLCPVCRAQVIG